MLTAESLPYPNWCTRQLTDARFDVLSVRAYNVIRNNTDAKTVEDLGDLSPTVMLKTWKNCGRRTVEEILSFLRRHNVAVPPYPEAAQQPSVPRRYARVFCPQCGTPYAAHRVKAHLAPHFCSRDCANAMRRTVQTLRAQRNSVQTSGLSPSVATPAGGVGSTVQDQDTPPRQFQEQSCDARTEESDLG